MTLYIQTTDRYECNTWIMSAGSMVFVKSILLLSLIPQEIIDYIIGIFATAETLSL